MSSDSMSERARALLPEGRRGRTVMIVLVVFLGFLLLYYPIGMALLHTIDDDTEYAVPEALNLEGGSRAVSMATALIRREVDDHWWVANDPFFYPSSALDNMPNFQQGIISALARFAFELSDQIGRTRGSSQRDEDLQAAAGELQFQGDVWFLDLSSDNPVNTVVSERRYRKAANSLEKYNARLAAGSAVFERRSDNLLATLDRIALDLGASSATLDTRIAEYSGRWLDTRADDIFYGVKGQTYAYYLLLRELAVDFQGVIAERQLTTAWVQMQDSLRRAAELQPLMVINGAPDAQVQPSHLASQGFYLLRARTQLREITNILLK
tara:strand:+ start:2638 stop:3612 length:975 start_codon:yes stop_codon:yes gene_type:complete